MKRRNFIQRAGLLPVGLFLTGKVDINTDHKTGNPDKLDLYNQYDPWIEIKKENIGWNVDQIRSITANKPIMAVIKCNAYGHGLVEMGRYLESIGISQLAVVKVREALALRKAGVKVPVLNFGPFSAEEAELLVTNNIMQSCFNDNVILLNETASKMNKIAKVHIKVDTGLGRVGIPHYRAIDYIKLIAGLNNVKIEGIFMSFTEDPEFDKIQLKRFLEVCNKAKDNGISVGLRHSAASSAVLSMPESHLDMVRPGILIYGHYPNDEEYKLQRIKVKPTLSLKTRISQVKEIRKGNTVSYRCVYKVEKDMFMATLPIGNYDGLPDLVVDHANVLVHGKSYKLLADMSGNHSYIFFENEKDIKTGDEIVIIGRQNGNTVNLEKTMKEMGNYSAYTFLMQLNPVIPRIYI